MTFHWTPELDRKLRELSLDNAIDCTHALASRNPASGAAFLRVAEGYATYHGEAPMTFAAGLGVKGGDFASELAAVERFYAARDVSGTIWVNDHTDPSFVRLLESRGYTKKAEHQTWFRLLGSDLEIRVSSSITVTVADKTKPDLWIRTVARGYELDEALTDELSRANADIFYSLGFGNITTPFLAYADQQPIAGGALTFGRGIAILRTASTLPNHRGKGAQKALIAARLQQARELGCSLALSNTELSTGPSAHNLMRFGFEPLRKSHVYGR